MSTLFESQAPRPLADRLRPHVLEEVVGLDQLLATGGPLRRMIDTKHMSSNILWGPPGTGKTSIARLLAKHTNLYFESLSAVFSGVSDLRKVIDGAKAPCKENKIEKKDINIAKQLPHVWFGKEGPSYITNAVVSTKDPETGIPNTGC